MGSAAQIGWEWYSRLAPRVPTTLVTHSRNRHTLAKAGAPVSRSTVIFVDTARRAGPLSRLARRISPRRPQAIGWHSAWDFFAYDRRAAALLRQRLAAGAQWDLVHAVTPVSPAVPTRLHRTGLPLILGPLNGGLAMPPTFPDLRPEGADGIQPGRRLGQVLDTLLGSTRHAAVILTATQATRASIPRRYRSQCIPMLENGVALEGLAPAPWPLAPSKTQALRLLFVGPLLPCKGVPLLLAAIQRLHHEFPVRLSIVGEGPMEAAWQEDTRRLGLQGLVTFCGPLAAPAVAAQLRAAHVFCLPSLWETDGAAVLEAMAAARPVIAIAYGGPGEVVDDRVGRAIPPEGPAAVVEALAHTLREVVADPGAWQHRGEEGRRRVEQRYGWEAKIEQALRLYRHLLDTR
jgi:glycosyltransferase involved in cell wall biosynthesis